jgi:uncharacterized OB-fold protein
MSDDSFLKFSKCNQCGLFQFPPRDLCSHCLSEEITWKSVLPLGVVLADTRIHYSLEEQFEETVPNHIGLIKLDIGPTIFANLEEELKKGDKVMISASPGLNDKETFYATIA